MLVALGPVNDSDLKIISSELNIFPFKYLQELNVNFRNIIVPETVKSIQRAEPSVMETLSTFNTMLADIGIPVETLLSQLEVTLRNTIMGMEVNGFSFNQFFL